MCGVDVAWLWRGCGACYGYVTAERTRGRAGGQYVLRSFHIHIIVDFIRFLV